MIAQIVFDLPIDGPFDYWVPEHLVSSMTAGIRVKVSFGPRVQIGYVIGLLDQSTVSILKPIQSLCDSSPVFNSMDLAFAKDFCAFYACSLGEGLSTMLRNKEDHMPSIRREHKPLFSLYRSHPSGYTVEIQKIIDGYINPLALIPDTHSCSSFPRKWESRFLILVPDVFRAQTISRHLKGSGSIKFGTRSCVFECDGRYDCVIMVDEEDASYKQEQMPMYETRQVLLMRSKMFGFDIAFMGISPSVELMSLVREKQIKLIEEPDTSFPSVRLVDLSNYKFIPGLLTPPVRDALDKALIAGEKSILVLNRRGSYRLTRCVDCAEILKCSHCDSPLIYSRSKGEFLCRHCTYRLPGDAVCPKCHKPSWRSQGIGVEQLQTELKKYFPQAKIIAFERATKVAKQSLPEFDILIATQAVLRFQGVLQAQMAAFIDFDAELNRLDMRSAFNAFSLVLHISSMVFKSVFIQTRNRDHYVLKSLSRGKTQDFYDDELKLRKEFGFSPFKHWVRISWRGKSEKSTHQVAQDVYNVLSKSTENYIVTPPLADAVGRKRDQFRFNVMLQADQVPLAVAFIKSTLAQIKRHSRVITTMNVDP